MVKLIWILLAGLLLGVGAWFGLGAESYVLVRLGDWAVQLSIWAALLLLGCLWILYVLLRLALSGFGLFDWLRQIRQRRIRKQVRAGFVAYFEGDWKNVAKGFVRSAEKAEDPMPLLMLAALASSRSGDAKRALSLLENLETAHPENFRAIALVRAQVHANAQQMAAGKEVLAGFRARGPASAEATLIEAQLAHLEGDMDGLQRCLQSLQSHRMSRVELAHLQRYFYLYQLSRQDISAEQLKPVLKSFAVSSLSDPGLVRLLVARLGDIPGDDAAEILAGLIEKSWHPQLVAAFGEIESSQPRKQLKRAERWHEKHLSVELLETLQKLAWRANDADRAHDYAQQMRVLRRGNP